MQAAAIPLRYRQLQVRHSSECIGNIKIIFNSVGSTIPLNISQLNCFVLKLVQDAHCLKQKFEPGPKQETFQAVLSTVVSVRALWVRMRARNIAGVHAYTRWCSCDIIRYRVGYTGMDCTFTRHDRSYDVGAFKVPRGARSHTYRIDT